MSNKYKGELAIFAAALLYGLFGVFSRLISFSIPLFYQQWVRNIFALFIILILIMFFRGWKKLERQDIKWFVLRSTCGLIGFVGAYVAFTKISIGTTYFVAYASAAICGYLVGKFMFGEKLDKVSIISLIFALIGLILIYAVNFNTHNAIYLLGALAAGVTTPGWTAFSKKISGTYSNLQLNFMDALYTTLVPFTISLILREKWVPITFSLIWVEVFLFAAMFMVIGFLIVYGFRYVEAQTGTLILLFEIIAGVILAYIFFKETVPLQSLGGGALIILAIAVQTRKLELLYNRRSKTK